jgi:imidazolonepropionase-like amidohydrolase
MTVIVQGGIILRVTKDSEVKIPSDATVINAKGKYLTPGLWDMHAHPASIPKKNWAGDIFLPLMVTEGVTSIRDLGGNDDYRNALRMRLESGELLGPRIESAGLRVNGPKPQSPSGIWDYVDPIDEGMIYVSTASEAESLAKPALFNYFREHYGIDFLKPYDTLTLPIYEALITEARRHGIVVAGHVPPLVGAIRAAELGQRSIEHLSGCLLACSAKEDYFVESLQREYREHRYRFGMIVGVEFFYQPRAELLDSFDERKLDNLIEVFKRQQTWQVPTLVVHKSVIDGEMFIPKEARQYLPPDLLKGWEQRHRDRSTPEPGNNLNTPEEIKKRQRQALQLLMKILERMYRAGVPVMAGSDFPAPFLVPGYALHQELELLVEAGMTPLDALRAATINAARYLGQDHIKGSIEPAKAADMVLLDADPLHDIKNTRRIFGVMLRGQWLDGQKLHLMRAEAARRAAFN